VILVFGKTGQAGCELARRAEVVTLDRAAADLTDPDVCATAISVRQPSAVINAAGWTAVDKAEDNEAEATVVNGVAPDARARACAALCIPFVHLSTDYVFDGTGTSPWQPGDKTEPLVVYGRSKLMGEQGVAAAGGIHAIVRTSWVFSAHGANFVKTMLRLGVRCESLNVVADQIGGPTPAGHIAEACLAIAGALAIRPHLSGIYHLSGAPDVSWADFARAIFVEAGLACTVNDIPSSAYPTPARRPSNSRLDCSSLREAFGIGRADWRRGLVSVLGELKRGSS